MNNLGTIVAFLCSVAFAIINLAVFWIDPGSNWLNGLIGFGCVWAAWYWTDQLK